MGWGRVWSGLDVICRGRRTPALGNGIAPLGLSTPRPRPHPPTPPCSLRWLRSLCYVSLSGVYHLPQSPSESGPTGESVHGPPTRSRNHPVHPRHPPRHARPRGPGSHRPPRPRPASRRRLRGDLPGRRARWRGLGDVRKRRVGRLRCQRKPLRHRRPVPRDGHARRGVRCVRQLRARVRFHGRRAGRIQHADRSRRDAGWNHRRRRPETPRLPAL